MSQVKACDKCGTSQGTVKEIRLWYSSHPDPSGNGSEDDILLVDLCENCLFSFMKFIGRLFDLTPILAEKMRRYLYGKRAED